MIKMSEAYNHERKSELREENQIDYKSEIERYQKMNAETIEENKYLKEKVDSLSKQIELIQYILKGNIG